MRVLKGIIDIKKSVSYGRKTKMKKVLIATTILGMVVSSTVLGSTIVMSTDVPKAIPENNPVGVTSTLVFPSMIIVDVDLILTITHTCIPDIHIELTSPAGTTAHLVDAWTEGGIFVGIGCPDNFVNTHFDDDAPTNLLNGVAPYTGHFNIDWPGNDKMSFFDGQNAGGMWTLFVSDLAAADTGTLQGWGLEIVPEPCTLILLALGGLALRRKRRA